MNTRDGVIGEKIFAWVNMPPRRWFRLIKSKKEILILQMGQADSNLTR